MRQVAAVGHCGASITLRVHRFRRWRWRLKIEDLLDPLLRISQLVLEHLDAVTELPVLLSQHLRRPLRVC